MDNFRNDNLEIRVSESDAGVTMEWIGKCDSKEMYDQLVRYFRGLLDQLQAKPITIRFNGLESFNSSSISPIIGFLTQLNARGIATKVFYNAKNHFQNISFQALEVVVRTLKNVTIVGEK